jgi:gas vesicle protein
MMRKIFSFFTGMITGGLVGATLAILLAPMSGEDIRGQLQERTNRLREDIKAAAQARRAELERELEVLRTPRSKE